MTLSVWFVINMKEQHYDDFRYLLNYDCSDCPRRDGCRRNISRVRQPFWLANVSQDATGTVTVYPPRLPIGFSAIA